MKNLIHKLNEERPDFLTERIEDCSIALNKCKYAKEILYRSSAAINVFDVNCVENEKFCGKTWLELLTSHERPMKNAIFHASCYPEYYMSSSQKNLDFKRIGQYLTVSACGAYRSALAKAVLNEANKYSFRDVSLTDYIIDFSMLEAHKYLQYALYTKRYYLPEGHSKIIPRLFSRNISTRQGIGWKSERKMPFIQLLNKKTDEKMDLFSSKDVMDFIGEINSSPLLRCFRANKYARFCK